MRTLRSTSIILAVIALALIVAPVAMANSVTYNTTIGTTATNFSGATGSLSQFDPSLGTLTAVKITLTGNGSTVLTVTAQNPDYATVLTALYTDVGLLLTDPGDVAVHNLQTVTGGPAVDEFDPLTVNYGFPYNSGSQSLNSGDLSVTQTLNSNLSSFIGLGTVTFDLAGAASTTESFTGGEFIAGQNTDAGAGVTIEYDYTPPPSGTPEPGTLTLFGTGLLGLAGALRLKLKSR